jgi:hypothetical protein
MCDVIQFAVKVQHLVLLVDWKTAENVMVKSV